MLLHRIEMSARKYVAKKFQKALLYIRVQSSDYVQSLIGEMITF